MSGTITSDTGDNFDPDAHFWGWEALPALDRMALSVGGVFMGGSIGVVLALVRWATRAVL